jgi:hypothetical protein
VSRPRGVPAAAVVALLAGLVAGCSGGEPPAAPSATLTATGGTLPPPTTEAGASTTASAGPADTGAKVGGLVSGFPTDVVPVPPGAQVSVSSVTAADGRRQVSLAGQTKQPAADLAAFYTKTLEGQGFTLTEAPLPAGVTGGTYSKDNGEQILTLSVTSAQGEQQFTIGGFIAP